MSEPLMLAASLLTGETVGLTPQSKPEDDLWKLVDQMSVVDQQRVEAYQRRSQPLAMKSSASMPETARLAQYSPQTATLPQVKRAKYSEVAYNLQPTPVQRVPNLPTSAQGNFKPQATSFSPSSGSELYSQRMGALQEGELYTRLKGNSYQTAWAGTTQQPTHEEWQKLLRQEASSVAKGQGKNRLGVLVGDSLSMWFPSEMLPQGKLWLNQGISGENSGQILQRLDALDDVHPETIYVMAGVNDLKQGASEATVLNNTRAIIRRLQYQHPHTTIVLQSLLPTRHSYLSPQRAMSLNKELQAIATEENAGYLNLHALFVDQDGKMRTDLTTDGLHLNRKGYSVWQGAMQQAENWVATKRAS